MLNALARIRLLPVQATLSRSAPAPIYRTTTSAFIMAQQQRKSSALPTGYVEDKSKGPMLRFQDSLPRLPVPTLQETAQRYLKTLHPLLSRAEFEASTKAVQEFIAPGGIGETLQKRLIARREDPQCKNWLWEWWNDGAYLGYRDPVVPYVSYFYSHRDDRRRRDPAKRAAAITVAVLEFKKMVDGGTLEPEYMKKLPICMDSYKYMYNCSRIAARPSDYPQKFDGERHKHIAVVRKNQWFKVAYEVDGKALSAAELEAQFRRVYELATTSLNVPAVGALTSQNRDVWADARRELIAAAPGNAAALEAIESSAFVVCLDDAAPVTLEERAHQYWHGDGMNRWYDKPLQFIVCDNGASGFMGEHSMMDGTPTHRLNDWVCDMLFNDKLPAAAIGAGAGAERSGLADPAMIRFEGVAEHAAVEEAIQQAKAHFAAQLAGHELRVQAFQGYGKGLIKRFGFSPDAYVQMIIQLAYRMMYGVNRPVYESAATRRFQLGRTETCRSVSDASAAWCAAMMESSTAANNDDAEVKRVLFRAAIAAHLEYISAASDGKGVDRHLLGLRKLLQPGERAAIFEDPAYAYSSSWFVSSSQLSSEFFNGYGWSQVIDAGFGIAYMINENSINFNIVSKKLGCERMSFYLNQAAMDMKDLLMPTLEAPKSRL